MTTSHRTAHTLQMQSLYLTYRDEARGCDPYFNEKLRSVFEELERRGPPGTSLLFADTLYWLANAHKALGDRGLAEIYMRKLIDFLLQIPIHRESLGRNFMKELEIWLIQWGENKKAADIATWREEELGAEAAA